MMPADRPGRRCSSCSGSPPRSAGSGRPSRSTASKLDVTLAGVVRSSANSTTSPSTAPGKLTLPRRRCCRPRTAGGDRPALGADQLGVDHEPRRGAGSCRRRRKSEAAAVKPEEDVVLGECRHGVGLRLGVGGMKFHRRKCAPRLTSAGEQACGVRTMGSKLSYEYGSGMQRLARRSYPQMSTELGRNQCEDIVLVRRAVIAGYFSIGGVLSFHS